MAADTRPLAPPTARVPRRWHVLAFVTFALAGGGHRPCSHHGRSLRGVWDESVRDPLVTALNKVPGERAGTLAALADLDRLARAWTDTRAAVHRHVHPSEPRAARRLSGSRPRRPRNDRPRPRASDDSHHRSRPRSRPHRPPPAARLRPPRRRRPALRPAAHDLVVPAVALADPTAAAQASRAEVTLRTGSPGHATKDMSSSLSPRTILADLARPCSPATSSTAAGDAASTAPPVGADLEA